MKERRIWSTPKGNVIYKITGATPYNEYQWPYMYFGGGVTVNGNVTYQGGGLPNRPFNSTGLTVLGRAIVS